MIQISWLNLARFVGRIEPLSYGTGFLCVEEIFPLANRIPVTLVTKKVMIAVTHDRDSSAAALAPPRTHPGHKLCS